MTPTSRARCPHCQAKTPKLPNRPYRYAVLSFAWVVAMAGVFIGICTGPFIIAFLPLVLWGGIATVTAGHEFAFGDYICRSCGRAVTQDGVMLVSQIPEPEFEHVPEQVLAA